MIALANLLKFKWTWLIIGGVLVALGAYFYTTAHPAAPVQIDGTIADYEEFTQSNRYDHNELTLTGNSTTYMLNKTDFHPALPESLYKQGKVSIWVDSGSTTVIAMTLYDENDQNPIKYTTPHYDNPASEQSDSRSFGIVAGVMGLILVGVFGLMFVLGRRVRPAVATPAVASSATAAVGTISPDGKWYWDGVRWVSREAQKLP